MPDDLRASKDYYAVGGCGGNIAWHTENDTLEIADRENLLRDMRVYGQAVLGVANAEILPFDWSATAAEFATTISRYQKAAGATFDLSPAAEALGKFDKAISKFNRAAKSGRLDADKANFAIMRLARILIPINFAREARFRHDPALPIPQLPILSVAEDIKAMPKSMQGFARTQLTRAQNRVVAALRDATMLIEAADA